MNASPRTLLLYQLYLSRIIQCSQHFYLLVVLVIVLCLGLRR